MTALTQACKAIVTEAIDREFFGELPYTVPVLCKIYSDEYGNYNGTTPKACKDYLQGLPSVCTVPFYNGDILNKLEGFGIMRKNTNAQDRLIEAYWAECGNQFYKLIK